jgi:hypothetical protein
MSLPSDLPTSRYAELNPALHWFPAADNVENADGQRCGFGFMEELSWEHHSLRDFPALEAGFREYKD